MPGPAPTTRARKVKFLASFDSLPGDAAQRAVAACLRRHGLAWLTDAQLAEITVDVAADALAATRRRNRNRQHLRSVA